jgi:hypothetical protein
LQAREAIAIANGRAPALAGGILIYDASGTPRMRFTMVSPRAGCLCGAYQRMTMKKDEAHARH